MPRRALPAAYAAYASVGRFLGASAVLYIVTRSLDQGRRAGLVSVLGVHAGTLVHVAAAAAGLSALLSASATAFGVVKYLGAAYPVYLGARQLLGSAVPAADPRPASPPLRRAFLDGFVVNVLNPKTALFFLAFLPQFVTVSLATVPLQIVALGVVFVALGLLTDGFYALAAPPPRGSARAGAPPSRGAGFPARCTSASVWRPRSRAIGSSSTVVPHSA